MKSALTKIGLGLALFSGCALLQPAVASAQDTKAHIETVDHHGGRGWDRGRGGYGRGWNRGYNRSYWGPRSGGYYPGVGLGFYLGTAPNYSYYYNAPAYPAYPPAAGYYPPATAYSAPGYPPTNGYSGPAYPPANSYPGPGYPPAAGSYPPPSQNPY